MWRTLRVLVLAAVALAPVTAQTYRGLIGAEIEIGEGNRSRAFVDIAKTFRPLSTPVDQNGWPTTDFEMLFFDNRPYAGWDTSIGIDDPEKYIPDWSGDYKLSFKGQASISSAGDPVTIKDELYDAATNTTTATVSVSPSTALLVLKFTNTKSGVTDLKLIRPGYPAEGSKVFTDEFLRLLQPYSYLRFMGALDTNGADADYDPAKPLAANQKKWSDRHLPTDATQQFYGNKHGLAWEYVIEIANASGKDIWINVPVSANDDYVTQLARLTHDTLKPGIRIYIEHGNEVWNGIFTTYKWNKAATQAEIEAGHTNLNATDTPLPPSGDWVSATDDMAQRRHARRLAEIGKIFLNVYGADAFGRIIRPVYAGWTIIPSQYDRVLQWVRKYVGEPNTLYYAIAQTHYYNDASVRAFAKSTQDILNAFRANSDSGRSATTALQNIASAYGVKHVIYEGGADILRNENEAYDKNWVPLPTSKVPALAHSITACRDAQMKDIVIHDAMDNWFALGGDQYTYFTMSGGVSRWGCWGAVEDVVGPKATSPKLEGILQLVGGAAAAPSIDTVVNAATYKSPIAPGAFASVFGSNLTDQGYDYWGGMVAGGRLPSVVGGVMVQVGGKDCVISYAGPGQINFIVPPDVSPGQATITVTSGGGSASATVQVAADAPGFFGYALGDNFQLAAVFANTGVYVAPEGALPTASSRPAKPGEWLELYVTGLGAAGAPYGTVLTQAYPIDKAQVAVMIDGLPAPVDFAGMTYAGVFQVNVQVPALTRGGGLPVTLTIRNQQTPQSGVLTFALP